MNQSPNFVNKKIFKVQNSFVCFIFESTFSRHKRKQSLPIPARHNINYAFNFLRKITLDQLNRRRNFNI